MHSLKLSILLLVDVAWHCLAVDDTSALLQRERNLKANGVHTVLTFEGIERAAESIVKAIIPDLPHIPSHPRSRNVTVGDSSLTVENMRVLAVSEPQSFHVGLSEPNALLISMRNFIISTECSLKESLSDASAGGQAVLESRDTTLDVVIGMKRRPSGSPLIDLLKCSTVKSSSRLSARLEGLPSDDIQQVQRALVREGAELMEGLLCAHVEWIVDSRLNERFANMPTSVSLADLARANDLRIAARKAARRAKISERRRIRRTPESAIAVIDSFNLVCFIDIHRDLMMFSDVHYELEQNERMSRAGSLLLDYGMLSDPVISLEGVGWTSSGEVSVGGRRDTPFGSVPLPAPASDNSTEMLKMVISDFLPNSLMYHGHRIGLFNTRVDPTTPQLGPVMRTSCGLNAGPLFCLGDLLPTLRHFHPNKGIAMDFESAQPPVIIFQADPRGAFFAMNGHLAIWAIDERRVEKKVGDASIEIEAFIKFRVVGALLKAKLSLEKIHMKSLNSEALDQDELDDASLLGHEIIQRIVNDVLKDGIPIPIHQLFRIRKTRVTLVDRACILTTDFQLDSKILRKLTTARRAS